ncbi:HRDC domain-containing protein [Gleimia hominis]|uniref:HRDC domain-containing protein n=1 Tax=Gleimia hominis TaxID=595468 RepID=A0ABU3IBH0_9ACTO|nr:HRDC domain-containing protein [Gleimia hominis]MDT3767726.1 HRDC domain-containing protein [Gleimia hominis]
MSDTPKLIIHPREGTPDITDTPQQLQQATERLARSHMPVAVDVERASGYRYFETAYLVQIRREDVGTFLIDSHALADLSSMNAALGNAVWVLHAADQDLESLRMAKLHVPAVFDTEVAAQLLGYEQIGLAAVCERALGVTLDKDHQRSDWSRRPLPHAWLRYAALDVELLTELQNHLGKALYERGRWEWAEQEFDYILNQPPKPSDPNRWRTFKGAGKVEGRRHLAVLRELWNTRENVAREHDIAPTRLISNATLVRLALKPPRNKRALLSIQAMRRPRTRKYTAQWMSALMKARSLSDTDLPPRRLKHPHGFVPKAGSWRGSRPEAFARLQRVRAIVNTHAKQLQVDPIRLLEPRVQRALAWDEVAYPEPEFEQYMLRLQARPWQVEQVGAQIHAAIVNAV